MSSQPKSGSVFYATFLVAGTCIGISFLSIPLTTGVAGFVPALLVTTLIWIFAFANGFLYAEATIGTPDGSNLFSIASTYLGRTVALIASAVFVMNMYAYISSYYIAGSHFLNWLLEYFPGISLPFFVGRLLIALIFGFIVFLGVSFSSRFNALFFLGLIGAFFFTLFQGSRQINLSHFTYGNWYYIVFAVPIIFSAYGFNSIVPTLCTYLNRDKKRIQKAIFFGTTITFLIYAFWQMVLIGSVAQTPLWVAFSEGEQALASFPWVQDIPLLIHAMNFIIFFAAVTSVICIGMSLVDFFSDCIKIPVFKRSGWKRLAICCAIFLPALAIAQAFEGALLPKFIDKVIAPSGGIIINGILPVIMVAKGRYYMKLSTPPFLPGRGYLLLVMGLAIFFLIYLEGVIWTQ